MKRNCSSCRHYDTEICDNCSQSDDQRGCSYHTNPPCSFCTNNYFEEKINEL
jgi:radical SAM superfamily enzyme with C-terminal helix-hairpin-helix motif